MRRVGRVVCDLAVVNGDQQQAACRKQSDGGRERPLRAGRAVEADQYRAVGERTVLSNQALRPGGRLVQLVWQVPTVNPWFLDFTNALAAGRTLPTPPVDAPAPFSLSDPQRMDQLLVKSGFSTARFEALYAPMHFGADADQAYGFVAGMLDWMLDGLDDTSRARALSDLRMTIRAHETGDGVLYPSATWLVTATLRQIG